MTRLMHSLCTLRSARHHAPRNTRFRLVTNLCRTGLIYLSGSKPKVSRLPLLRPFFSPSPSLLGATTRVEWKVITESECAELFAKHFSSIAACLRSRLCASITRNRYRVGDSLRTASNDARLFRNERSKSNRLKSFSCRCWMNCSCSRCS